MSIFNLVRWIFPLSVYQPSVAAAMVGAAVVGGVASNSAAKKGARAQEAAADKDSAAEREMFDLSRADQEPWRERGNAAGERLNYLLGLSSDSRGGAGSTPGNSSKTEAQIRQELLPEFRTGGEIVPVWRASSSEDGRIQDGYRLENTIVDETALGRAVQQRLQQQLQQQQSEKSALEAARESRANDPSYGSLLRRFSMSDMQADPVYQSGLEFGLSEGRKGLERIASARGGLNSGATLKALTRFGNDYGSTKANESYNRFNNDNTNIFNRLSGVSGTGQTSAAQIGSQAIQTGQSIGNNLMGAGNARASGYVGSANAINSAVGQGVNMYQQNEMMKRMFPASGASGGNFLSNNQAVLNQGLTPNDLYRGF